MYSNRIAMKIVTEKEIRFILLSALTTTLAYADINKYTFVKKKIICGQHLFYID